MFLHFLHKKYYIFKHTRLADKYFLSTLNFYISNFFIFYHKQNITIGNAIKLFVSRQPKKEQILCFLNVRLHFTESRSSLFF